MSTTETFKFQAEINQLMHLIINAFYSNKDIFLRELISNASDACNKQKYHDLQNSVVKDYEIRLSFDKENKFFTIEDNGIGMNKTELVDNLGTIANSGTKAFMENLKTNGEKNNDLIGQFGVGFYSSYLVADRVTVVSKMRDSDAYQWDSSADGQYTITTLDECNLFDNSGTRIVLHMKDDQTDYCSEKTVRDIVKKHSQFITYPIKLFIIKKETVDMNDDEQLEQLKKDIDLPDDSTKGVDDFPHVAKDESNVAEDVPKDADNVSNVVNDLPKEDHDVKVEDDSDNSADEENEDEENKPNKNTKTIDVPTWEQLNEEKPLWTKPASDVTEQEYQSFYKNISNDNDNYLAVKQFNIEGNVEFKGILYIPKKAPFDMFSAHTKKTNVKLFAKKVFIMDNCEELVPDWMSFISGVVDCNDLQLNVSREMLQQSKVIKVIKKHLVKKVFEMLDDLVDSNKFNTFYDAFSKNLKLGAHEDNESKEKFCKFLKFHTNKSKDETVFLDTVIDRLQEGQVSLYYISGENLQTVQQSSFLERLNKKNYEVIFMVDNIDEYLMQNLKDYKGKQFVDITKDSLKLDDEYINTENLTDVCTKIKNVLGDKVQKVVVTQRLSDSPACLVTGGYGWTANMERIMKSQALNNNPMSQFMIPKKTLEINPTHPIIAELVNMSNDTKFKNIVDTIYDVALLGSGFVIENTSEMAQKLWKMMSNSLSSFENVENNVVSVEQSSDQIEELENDDEPHEIVV